MSWLIPVILAVAILVSAIIGAGWGSGRARRNRLYTLVGVVQVGLGLGSQTGVHTANLDVAIAEDARLPPGVYRCSIFLDERRLDGLLYYGENSLAEEDCLEVHIFNFFGELYGKRVTVQTRGFVRRPRHFSSVEELKKQIEKDLLIGRK